MAHPRSREQDCGRNIAVLWRVGAPGQAAAPWPVRQFLRCASDGGAAFDLLGLENRPYRTPGSMLVRCPVQPPGFPAWPLDQTLPVNGNCGRRSGLTFCDNHSRRLAYRSSRSANSTRVRSALPDPDVGIPATRLQCAACVRNSLTRSSVSITEYDILGAFPNAALTRPRSVTAQKTPTRRRQPISVPILT